MESQKANQSDKKQKQVKPEQNKEEKPKKKIITSPSSTTNKESVQSPNNQKAKINYNMSDSKQKSPSQKNEQNQKNINETKKIKKDHKLRSVSQEKDRNANKNNTTNKNTRRAKHLSMEKNIDSETISNAKSPVNLKSPKKSPLENKGNKNKKGKKEEVKDNEIDPLIENYDPNLYGFNLYKHIKDNLRYKDKLCKHKLSKDSYYCLDCKISTCKKCLSFPEHEKHNLIPKFPYYESDQKIINDSFNEIDALVKQNPDYINSQKLKDELKKVVNDSIDRIIKRLNEVKDNKIKELDKLFEKTDGSLNELNKKKEKLKDDIKVYLKKQKDFYFINVKEEEEEKENENEKIKEIASDPDFDLLKNLKKNTNIEPDVIESNNDTYNTTFLISYDIYKNTLYINEQICKLFNDIKTNKFNYLVEFNGNIKQINDDIDKLNKPFNGIFNYSFLSNDYYKMVTDKLKKYGEKIDAMRRYIFDMANRDGNYEAIDNDNRYSETRIKQRFDNILNYQIPEKDKDDRVSIKTKSLRGKNVLHRLSLYLNSEKPVIKIKTNANNATNATISSKNDKKQQPKKVYNKPEDIKLDKGILQEYYAYESYNTIHNYFRYKKPKPEDEIVEYLDDEIDIARPVPGTNEMLLYDKKTANLIKKEVKFDKKKHKYTYFLNGCRSVLIKDMLYIFGGVDREKKPTKVAYVYLIKTNELKVMPEMLKPHAYHSVEFLDFYKSIIVVGGEKSAACEIFDLFTGLWKELPDMNIPKAHCNLFLDKFTHVIYTFFGVVGDITEKNNYIDIIECLELKKLALGWSIIDYNNKAEMDFKSGYSKILPLSKEMVLIYGAANMRNNAKKAAVYLIPKCEIVKIDKKIFNEITEKSKYSRKLSKILMSYI
jgi:hypothetical protein